MRAWHLPEYRGAEQKKVARTFGWSGTGSKKISQGQRVAPVVLIESFSCHTIDYIAFFGEALLPAIFIREGGKNLGCDCVLLVRRQGDDSFQRFLYISGASCPVLPIFLVSSLPFQLVGLSWGFCPVGTRYWLYRALTARPNPARHDAIHCDGASRIPDCCAWSEPVPAVCRHRLAQ